MPDGANDEELPALPIARIEHRGRVARVLIALALTTIGWLLPVPYAGYAFSLALFAPALILLAFATAGHRHRRLLIALGAPAALGALVSILGCVELLRFGSGSLVSILAWTLVTTFVAVFFGPARFEH